MPFADENTFGSFETVAASSCREIHQTRQFSEHTQELIDEEVARILHEASQTAEQLLSNNRDDLQKLTEALLTSEELSENEITELIGPSVHAEGNGREDASKSTFGTATAESDA